MNPEEHERLEQRLAELNQRLDELHDGYAPGGFHVMKLYKERGVITRQLAEEDASKGSKR